MEKGNSDMIEERISSEAAIKSTYIRSTATFFTAVITAAVLVTGLIVAGHLFGLSRTGGDGAPAGSSVASVGSTQAQSSTKMMDSDMSMEVGLMMDDDKMMMQRVSYDYDANVVLIDTPGNFYQNNSAATFAYDIDRSLVFLALHEENECIAYKLTSKMASELDGYLEEREGNVVELTTMPFEMTNFEEVGLIPDDYVKVTNGAIIRGLCAGKPTTWVIQSPSSGGGVSRRRRGCGFRLACSCSWFGCGCSLVFRCSWGK